jgi:hypothetical protein
MRAELLADYAVVGIGLPKRIADGGLCVPVGGGHGIERNAAFMVNRGA